MNSMISNTINVTRYLWEIGQLSESFERLITAERLCAETVGLNSLEAARIYVVRGNIYAHQNEWKEAGEMYNKALKIRQDLLSEENQILANSYMQMGNFYTSQSRLEEAIVAHTKAINIRKRTYAIAPSQMLISYLNYSRCLLEAKRLEDAEVAVRDAQKCEKDIEPHPDVLATA
jgi:tetratricopeptide (TPR) repeat protein